MSGYVYMKVLESAPLRYDRGIRWLSRGTIERVYARIAELAAAPGARVLDIGCGTGGLTLACAALGANVIGIDIDPGMLDVARSKPLPETWSGTVEWVELGAMEIEDRFPEEAFDAVVACLVFSEISPEEQSYVLRIVRSRLEPGGMLVIADEVLSPAPGRRFFQRLRRMPLAAWTYLLTQATTRPLPDLAGLVREGGYADINEERVQPGNLHIASGRRPEGAP